MIDLTGAQGGFWNDTNAPLMTVADLSKVWLTASVQEKDLAAVFVGQPAKFVLNAQRTADGIALDHLQAQADLAKASLRLQLNAGARPAL